MIASSRKIKVAAAVLALSAHGAAVLAVMPPSEKAEMEGMSGGNDLALGSAFADMAVGTLSSTPTEQTAEQTTPDEVMPEQAEPTPQETPEPLHAQRPVAEDPPVAPEPTEDVTAALPVVPPLEAEAVVPVAPTEQAEPEDLPDTLEALPAETVPPAEPEQAERPQTEPETLSAEAPEDTTEDAPETEAEAEPETEITETAPQSSMRPQPRRPDLAERQPAPEPQPQRRAEPQPDPEPRRQAQQPQGNADRNATAGAATGRAGGTSATAGSGGQANEAGNAAASNYPGQVMRKLSRVPRPRINARGAAVIAFRVSGGGGLAGLSVARSSGSAALDQAALRVVRSASPFPAPPAGAQTSFTVQIKGR